MTLTGSRKRRADERAATSLFVRLRWACDWLATHLPRGWTLSDEQWRARHRGIVALLWLHVIGVFVFGLLRQAGWRHAVLEAGAVATFAVGATSGAVPRRWRTIMATIGLLTSSAVLVHLSGGSIEMHFHFFVMVPLVALYQDWVAFLIAIGYVVLHHGVAGTLDPYSVFNHAAAYNQPWKWAAIHAFFITGISIVCLVTWRLIESALESAQAEARVKGEFLSVMSHEIRTPLTAVIGYAGLLSDTGLSAQQKQYADTIRRSGDRLLTLVNEILDYSKLEAGRLGLDEAPFDMLHLVDETVALVAEAAQQRGVVLASLVENSVPRGAVGDSGRIAQVLLNLVSNAVKFTDNGEVFVNVSAHPMDANRHEVVMSVRDSGIGIDPEDAERLFDAFTQAEPSTSRRYGGTGLGLAIARQLCELMGGTIEVCSAPGDGSTFRASFVITESVPDTRYEIHPPFAALRILVVGDSGVRDSLLGTYLDQWGLRFRTAVPATALLWARSGTPFDIVFIEKSSDAPDPFGLVAELRTLWPKEKTRLVLVASSAAPIAVASLFDSVLSQPVRQSIVFDLLASLQERQLVTTPPGVDKPCLAERHPLRILVAEDNHVNQKVLVSQLRRLGYSADVVSNGLEAVQAAGVRPYDVVLMDVYMPEMDGITAAREIHERLGSAAPVIVALTADVTPETKAECRAAGMAEYVAKPIRVAELREALMRGTNGDPDRGRRAS